MFSTASPTVTLILNAYCRHVPRLDLFQQSLKARAIEIRAGIPIVREMADILEALGSGVVFKVLFLIYNAVRFALLLIVAGQTLIKGSDFLFHIRLRPPFFQNVKMAESPLFQGFSDHCGFYVYAVNP